jgi:predicted metal-dependent peptidase
LLIIMDKQLTIMLRLKQGKKKDKKIAMKGSEK